MVRLNANLGFPPAMPCPARFALALLVLQAGITTIAIVLLHLEVDPEEQSGVVLIAWPIALGFALSAVGLARRTRWGYALALLVHAGLGVGLAPRILSDVVDGPEAALAFIWHPIGGPIFVVCVLNSVAAVGLARRPTRTWFGLGEWRWRRSTIG